MWFKRWVQRIRLYLIRRKYRNASPLQPNRKQCEELLSLFDPDSFAVYDPVAASVVALSIGFPNIVELAEKIEKTSLLLVEEKPIPRSWLKLTEREVSLDRFISIRGDHYINVVESVARFKKAGLELCALMQKSDTETAGIHEHNLRMLTRLFQTMQGLTIQLLDYGLAK